jgi:hypothetical protein
MSISPTSLLFGFLPQFKKGDIFFNYGCFPQTWEDPTFIHPDADGCRGDNDPLDVCEIGARIVRPGVSLEHVTSRQHCTLYPSPVLTKTFSFTGYPLRESSRHYLHDR